MRTVTESDWKKLRRVQPVALDRFCRRVLAEAEEICGDRELSAHERYLKLFKFIRDEDKDLARTFDGVSRSKAEDRAAWMRHFGLITDEEFAEFSEEFQARVKFYMGDN